VTSLLKTLNRNRVAQNLRASMMDGSWLLVAAAALILIAVLHGGH
jgi:hypothetical protein